MDWKVGYQSIKIGDHRKSTADPRSVERIGETLPPAMAYPREITQISAEEGLC
jgi:hypothetical protein